MSAYTGQTPDTRRPVDWREAAACLHEDPDVFYPAGRAARGLVAHAQAVCATCPVMEACGNWALATGEQWGIWGGMSENRRRQILRRRGVRLLEDPEAAP